MMLAGLPVPPDAVDELAALVRAASADDLAARLERALADDVKLLALTLDERGRLCSPLLRIRRRSSPSCAPSCSPITSGGGSKDSTDRPARTIDTRYLGWRVSSGLAG